METAANILTRFVTPVGMAVVLILWAIKKYKLGSALYRWVRRKRLKRLKKAQREGRMPRVMMVRMDQPTTSGDAEEFFDMIKKEVAGKRAGFTVTFFPAGSGPYGKAVFELKPEEWKEWGAQNENH